MVLMSPNPKKSKHAATVSANAPTIGWKPVKMRVDLVLSFPPGSNFILPIQSGNKDLGNAPDLIEVLRQALSSDSTDSGLMLCTVCYITLLIF